MSKNLSTQDLFTILMKWLAKPCALKRQEQLRHAVRAGIEELDRGEYVEYDDTSLAQFVTDIKALEESRYAGKGKNS